MNTKTKDRVKARSISEANHTSQETVNIFSKKDKDPYALLVSTLPRRVIKISRQSK